LLTSYYSTVKSGGFHVAQTRRTVSSHNLGPSFDIKRVVLFDTRFRPIRPKFVTNCTIILRDRLDRQRTRYIETRGFIGPITHVTVVGLEHSCFNAIGKYCEMNCASIEFGDDHLALTVGVEPFALCCSIFDIA
jgi:hypothetical protein